jgi:hypothetical protein
VRPTNPSADSRRKRDLHEVQAFERADFYRHKASECLQLAEAVSDKTSRDHWIDMANGWAQLALHVERIAKLSNAQS